MESRNQISDIEGRLKEQEQHLSGMHTQICGVQTNMHQLNLKVDGLQTQFQKMAKQIQLLIDRQGSPRAVSPGSNASISYFQSSHMHQDTIESPRVHTLLATQMQSKEVSETIVADFTGSAALMGLVDDNDDGNKNKDVLSATKSAVRFTTSAGIQEIVEPPFMEVKTLKVSNTYFDIHSVTSLLVTTGFARTIDVSISRSLPKFVVIKSFVSNHVDKLAVAEILLGMDDKLYFPVNHTWGWNDAGSIVKVVKCFDPGILFLEQRGCTFISVTRFLSQCLEWIYEYRFNRDVGAIYALLSAESLEILQAALIYSLLNPCVIQDRFHLNFHVTMMFGEHLLMEFMDIKAMSVSNVESKVTRTSKFNAACTIRRVLIYSLLCYMELVLREEDDVDKVLVRGSSLKFKWESMSSEVCCLLYNFGIPCPSAEVIFIKYGVLVFKGGTYCTVSKNVSRIHEESHWQYLVVLNDVL